jgi:hypothetical protein
MDPYAPIKQRYGFDLPETYRVLQGQGHLALPWEKYLVFQDCEWLNLEDIAEYEFNDWEIASDGGYVPFAITARHEPYCWRLDWAAGGEPAIVLCEQGEKAVCLAPDLRGLLYRLALEAFGGRNAFSNSAQTKDLSRAVDIVTPLLPKPWADRLQELRRRPWKKADDDLRVITWQECQDIIKSDLAFPHLDEKFIHDKEYLKRLKGR